MAQVGVGVVEASVIPWYWRLPVDAGVRRCTWLSMAGGLPGDIGVREMINTMVSNTIAFNRLVPAIMSWWGSRKSSPAVKIKCDGVRMTLNDDSPQTVRQVVEAWSAERS